MESTLTDFYTPQRPVRIILDTDIGPDCDDAGAVAVLHSLEKSGEALIAGMMHCTSSKWGAGCLDALNIYYGRPEIPIGTLKMQGFLDGGVYEKYNKEVTMNYPNRYRDEIAPDAVRLYRQLLTESEDAETVIVAIGPLPNIMLLLKSEADDLSPLSGVELVARKVKHLVVMGGRFPEGKEWNFEMHPESAFFTIENWPTRITFTGYEIGLDIHTGKRLSLDLPVTHPVRKSYEWYVEEGQTRPSWDLTAVLYAVRGSMPYWDLVQGSIEVDIMTGENQWVDNSEGKHAYLHAVISPEIVTELLDELMVLR